MSEYTVYVAVRITPEMKEDLDTIAQQEYTKLSSIIRRAIGRYVEHEKAKEPA